MLSSSEFEKRTEPCPTTGCWFWSLQTVQGGYGRVRSGNKMLLAHRMAWEIYNGPIEANQLVLHRCDVPLCVNPSHLFLGTQKDNVRDAMQKDRVPQLSERPTVCSNGHEYTEANTYTWHGLRSCKVCRLSASRRYRA